MSEQIDVDDIFGRGAEGAAAAAEKTSGSNYRRTVYLPKIGKGKSIVLRYLTDYNDLLYAQVHQGAKTKPKPVDYPADRKWPESMKAVCRYDENLQRAGIYHDCYICDHKVASVFGRGDFAKPRVRVFALAVLREEIVGSQAMVNQGLIQPNQVSKIVGYRDKMRTVKVPRVDANGNEIQQDGKTVFDEVDEPEIVVIDQSMNTWFSFAAAAYQAYGSLCGRDFAVRQEEEGKDVKYPHMPLDRTPGLEPGTDLWNERYMQPLARMGESFHLARVLLRQSSDDYYARFFDPNQSPQDGYGSSRSNTSGQQPVQQAAAPSNDVSADRLAAMKARIQGITPQQQTEQPQQSQQRSEQPQHNPDGVQATPVGFDPIG